MLRFCMAAAAAFVAGMASVGAQQLDPPGEPTPAQIVHAASTCTAAGAFEFRFGSTYEGQWEEADLPAADAPFKTATIHNFKGTIYEIGAYVSFQTMPGTLPESERQRGERFFRAVDERIKATRHFAVRKENGASILYRSTADHTTGYTLLLIGDGPSVEIYCTDKVLERKAWNGKPPPGSDY